MTDLTQRLFPVQQEQFTSDDYYTPQWVFERMGLTFDLDVCSPPGGVPWIPADQFFTQSSDGLAQKWHGRVWMNPPYSDPRPWVDRFIQHRHGVCLVPMSNGEWFHRLFSCVDGIALVSNKAFQFHGGGIPIRVCLMAFGDECVDAIGRLGVVRTVA